MYSLNGSYDYVVAKSRLDFSTCLLDHYATKAMAYEDDGPGLFLWRLSTLDLVAAQIGMKSHLAGQSIVAKTAKEIICVVFEGLVQYLAQPSTIVVKDHDPCINTGFFRQKILQPHRSGFVVSESSLWIGGKAMHGHNAFHACQYVMREANCRQRSTYSTAGLCAVSKTSIYLCCSRKPTSSDRDA